MSPSATALVGDGHKKRKAASNSTRLSVALPADVVQQIEEIAKPINASRSNIAFMLIKEGLKSREDRHARLTAVVHQLQTSNDAGNQKQLADELSSMLFPRDINAENSVGQTAARRSVAFNAARKRAKDQRRRPDKAR